MNLALRSLTRIFAIMTRSRFVSACSPSWLLIASIAIGCRSKAAPPEPELQASPTDAHTQAIAAPAAMAPSTANATTATNPASTANSTLAATTSPHVNSTSTPLASSATAPPATASASAPGGDPLSGKFGLPDALKGLPKAGKLIAELVTDAGTLKCELYEDKAPNTVANFVGLARGLRPFKDPKTGTWEKRPAYDNGVFHRIIKGFMIQGGDPTGTGAGDGGFVIPDEVWPGATHDRRGLLCMANKGKNTNSMQFFITDGAARHLDSGYTIFGSCGPDAVIEKLAASEVRGDRAITPPKIKKVTVRRGK